MKELKKYYRQIQKWLPCGGPLKRKMMANITATIEEYRSANPSATFADLQKHFGAPQQIAIAFVDEMDTQQLLRALHIRRKVFTIVIATALAVLTLWLGCVTVAYLEARAAIPGYAVVEIID